MIRARLDFKGKEANQIAMAVEPDNLPNMHLQTECEQFCIEFSTKKIGTLLSTVDDLLMNIKIAQETIVSSEER
jgi:hypothetical protein